MAARNCTEEHGGKPVPPLGDGEIYRVDAEADGRLFIDACFDL